MPSSTTNSRLYRNARQILSVLFIAQLQASSTIFHVNALSTVSAPFVASAASAPSAPSALSVQLLPPLNDDTAFTTTHDFSRTANWLIPGRVMCGHYPGACPSRQISDEQVAENLAKIETAGISMFVCLQDEIPPQDGIWPCDGIPKTSERAPLATGNFKNYRTLAGMDTSYVHYLLPDLSIAKSLNDLDEIVCYLKERVINGDRLYIHCWGGRGRTGLISACLLGALFDEVTAEQALERVQRAYSLREPWRDDNKMSPETQEQKKQVRDWFNFKRNTPLSVSYPTSGAIPRRAFGIWNNKGTEIIEMVSPTPTYLQCEREVRSRELNADKLGNGRFGQVFRGRCEITTDHTPVAIKVTNYIEDSPTHQQSKLALEATILRTMSGKKGFPTVLYDARQSVFGKLSDVLVMQLLGRPLLKRCWSEDTGDKLCKGRSFTDAAVMKFGVDLLGCLRDIHEAGFMHNDLKPMNMLFGAQGSGNEDDVHLVDFGMATRAGVVQDDSVGGCKLQAGGASPIFASLAQLEHRPTRPVDDVESLWYCLSYLLSDELPWQWEPVENLTNIKRRLYIDECGISSDECTALLSAEDCCSTKFCFETCDKWNVPDEMHELWWCIVEGQATKEGVVDYDACLDAMQRGANTGDTVESVECEL